MGKDSGQGGRERFRQLRLDLDLFREPPAISVSASERYVTSVLNSPALVDGDTNGADDVFVRDRLTGWYRSAPAGRRAGRERSGLNAPSCVGGGDHRRRRREFLSFVFSPLG